MLQQAIRGIFSHFPYEASLKYSAKFKPFRANVRLKRDKVQLNLSKEWKPVSPEIQIGLIQELLLKILKGKLKPLRSTTDNIELYNTFIKKLHLAIPKTKSHPLLESSFNRVNEQYFFGLIALPNLIWSDSVNKLGSYEYATDTIAISKCLMHDLEALDYVMYHEMLHKKYKFYTKNGRSYHHTRKFREKEKEFQNSALIERRLKSIIRKKKLFFDFL
jgi:hypothetical protein